MKFLISSTWKREFYDSRAVCDDIKGRGFCNKRERDKRERRKEGRWKRRYVGVGVPVPNSERASGTY